MDERYEKALVALTGATLAGMTEFESVIRRLDPSALGELRATLRPRMIDLEGAIAGLAGVDPPEALSEFHVRLRDGAARVFDAASVFCKDTVGQDAIFQVLASMRRFTRAIEALYPLHGFAPLGRFFVEPYFHGRLDELDSTPPDGVSVGLHRTGDDGEENARGGFCLYVPESYDGDAALPLVVALHGGSGDGRGFLWTWVREARGRRFLVLAPTSRGPTWSLGGHDVDAAAIASMVRFVSERWHVDQGKILLTGLSDGATYSLLLGLAEDSPFHAIAPVSGVLHPLNFVNGNMARARERRIYLVHGARDWMFPVHTARAASERLGEAGAAIAYREIEDLSHTYPREENARILEWFDPALALP